MAALKWIKIDTNIFANEKIKAIKMKKNSDEILVIWFEIMALAGRCNNGGLLGIDATEPMDIEMIAFSIGRDQKRVELAISIFEKYRMVEKLEQFYYLSNWERYQSTDKIERQREQTKIRVQKSRERKKVEINGDCNADVTRVTNALRNDDVTRVTSEPRNAPVTGGEVRRKKKDIDKDKETILSDSKEIEKSNLSSDLSPADEIKKSAAAYPYEAIVDAWNDMVSKRDASKPKVPTVLKRVGDNRRKIIKARIDQYGLESVYRMIEKVGASDYINGTNRDGWKASFDWCFTDTYFPKILEGNYDNKGGSNGTNRQGRQSSEQFGPIGTTV